MIFLHYKTKEFLKNLKRALDAAITKTCTVRDFMTSLC
jgi:hypothetical protein